ncbi:phage tail tape measure protein [Crassaminicella profunda]|uniref:phage tail tape measure protein n=1 Tax=Crassaminicella profunda TaxID=1286698 RepID=UPI001CA6BCDA|nr:phage tail tape measure protein [Crassaminicella profunda]QZY56712.1 phage tail tape measure protein [Crassaminicella profunda]
MAREREVNIIVDGQNRSRGAFLDVRRGLREMDREGRRATSNFSRNFRRVDSVVLSFSNRLKFMDKIAKRTFQGTAAAMSIYTVSTLRDFGQLEEGISKVNTLYDQTAQSQGKMVKDSIKMYKMIPTDFQKITQGLYDSISAGTNAKYASMVSRKFGQGAIAGVTEMPIVTKAAMGTMNAFGKEIKDLDHILDVQFLTVKRGITEYAQLASSLDTGILKAADSAGMTMEELYGGIAQITKNGIPAAQATTQLASMLARVTDPKVIKRMKEFGVELQDSHYRTMPLVEILKDLNEQFEKRKMTGAQQAGFLKEILGRQEAVRGFQTLISQVKEYGKIVDEMNHADGTMGEAFEDRLNNINTQLKLVWNNMKAAGVEQLYTLKPFLDSLTEPIIMKQKLEFKKMDLQDQLIMNEDEFKKEKISKDEYMMRKKVITESIALIDIQLKDLDITPVDKFRDGLKEGVEQLEKINPPLAKFVDAIGNLALNFVGEEGAENREKAGNVAKGLGALYAAKKLGDMYLWFRKFGKGAGQASSPAKALVSTLSTMTVNAGVVNVYGGTGGLPGRTPNTPTIVGPNGRPISSAPSNPSPVVATGGGLMNKVKGVATAASVYAVPLAVVAGTGAAIKYNIDNPEVVKKRMGQRNARENGIVLNGVRAHKNRVDILKMLRDSQNIENKLDLKNEVKVEAPKVTNRIYIDGKEIPIKRSDVTIEKVEVHEERLSRRYGRHR